MYRGVFLMKCILYDRECVDCGECRCDLDPEKICDNCMKCVRPDADYTGILVSGIQLEHENEDRPEDSHEVL